MYSDEYRRRACESGYHAYAMNGNKTWNTARRAGFGDPKIVWCWYTGFEAARTGQALKDAFATLNMKHGPNM